MIQDIATAFRSKVFQSKTNTIKLSGKKESNCLVLQLFQGLEEQLLINSTLSHNKNYILRSCSNLTRLTQPKIIKNEIKTPPPKNAKPPNCGKKIYQKQSNYSISDAVKDSKLP